MVSDPALTPNTLPEASTVAILLMAALHVPPDIVSVRLKVEPTHAEVPPMIVPASGAGLIVTNCHATSLPQAFVTV